MHESRGTTQEKAVLGRARELARISTVLERGRDLRRSTVVRITGETGCGLSAVLQGAADAARAGGWIVLDARCYASEARTPVALLRRIVRDALQHHGGFLDLYASGLRHDLEMESASAGRFEAAFLSLLEGLLLDHPVMLAVDDAHWLDGQSLAALRVLLQPARERCPAVVMTNRTGADMPVLPAEAELSVVVPPLPIDVAETVVRAVWPAAPDDVVRAIVARANGVPFELVSLAERAAADSASGADDVAASADAVLREIVLAMAPEQRSFIQTCALIGDPVELRLLRRVFPGDDVLDRALGASNGLLVQDGPVLRFKHALIVEAVSRTLSRPLVMRRRVLSALCATSTRGPAELDRIAALAADIGDVDAEFDALFALGSSAVAEDAYEAAIAAFERALAVRVPRDTEFVRFYNEYSIALRQIARWREAHAVLERAVDDAIVRRLPGAGVLASALLWAVFVETDRESARVAYRALRERIAGDEREPVDAMGAYFAAEAADVADFEAIRALHAQTSAPSRYGATTLQIGTAILMSRQGRYPEAMAAIATARAHVDVHRSVHRFSVDCFGSQVRFRQHGCAGARVQLGWLEVRDDGSIVSEAPPRMVLLYALELAAVADMASGQWGAALAKVDAASLSTLVHCAARTKLLAIAAAVAVLSGDASPYARMIEDDLRHCFARALWHRALPLVFWWAAAIHPERPRDALALAQPFRHLIEYRVDSTTMHFPIARVLYARRTGDRELLRALTHVSEIDRAPWNHAQELLAAGAAQHELGEEGARATLERAAAAFDALEAPFFGTYAASLAETASDVRTLPEGVVASGDVRAKARNGRYLRKSEPTLREQEIASLVAEGHTNRAIAERLTLSERTIEVHVANLFAKLNVASRTQLARVVFERRFADHRSSAGEPVAATDPADPASSFRRS